MVNFKNWVLARYLGKDSARGDFAADMVRADDAPEEDRKERWIGYLTWEHHACPEAMAVFRRMWADYEKWQRAGGLGNGTGTKC